MQVGCRYRHYVVEKTDARFEPPGHEEGADWFTEALAQSLTAVTAAYAACIELWPVVVGFGIGGPMILGYVWSLLLRLFAATMMYALIIALVLALVALDWYLALKAGVLPDYRRERYTTMHRAETHAVP